MSVTPEELAEARHTAESVQRAQATSEPWVRSEHVDVLARAFLARDENATALEKSNEKLHTDMATIHGVAERNSEVHTGFVHIRRIAASNLIP